MGEQQGYFEKLSQGSKTWDMNYGALGEMFGGIKFPLLSMWGQAEGLACADPGARTPIGISGNFQHFLFNETFHTTLHSHYDHY